MELSAASGSHSRPSTSTRTGQPALDRTELTHFRNASTTHVHLVQCIAALCSSGDGVLRILDMGFGDGKLLALCRDHLPGLVGRDIELFGIDVYDDRIQPSDFAQAARHLLGASADLHIISTTDAWPFPSAKFDVICSGQVGEHLFDIEGTFGEIARTLRPGGRSVHVFQLRDCIQEWHVGIPFAHRFRSHEAAASYLTWAARLSIARIGPLRMPPAMTPETFGHSRADYVNFHTYYRTWPEVAVAAKRAGLRISHRFTPDLYMMKLGYFLNRDFSASYRHQQPPLLRGLLFWILKHLASITVVLESLDTYEPPPTSHAEPACSPNNSLE